MAFHAYQAAIELIEALREPAKRLQSLDPDLADQLRRAASSIGNNLAEGARREGRDRTHHFRIAAGSAAEVKAALEIARAWGHLGQADIAAALFQLDRVLAMTWRLTHRSPGLAR